MNYRSIAVSLSLLAVVGVASATTQASKQRLDAIWSSVDERVSRQIDVWFEDGDYPKAIHMLVVEASYSPHDYDVVTNLGWMQENVEEWDQALATYELYRKNNPNDKDRALAEASFLYRRKEYAKVPPLLEPLLKEKPHPNNFRVLAHCYEKMNKLQDAKRVWTEYLALAPKDATAKVNLNRVEKKLNATKT